MTHAPTMASRRSFLQTAASAGAAAMLSIRDAQAAQRPDSKINGVQIGTITYSFRSLPGFAEQLLGYITQCGISSVELMGGPAEKFAKEYGKAHPDETAADPMAGFKALRKLYADAGVGIHIVKFGNIGNPKVSDEKIEYYFQVAKALGAGGITRERSEAAAKRLGPVADRHQIMIGFHNHARITPDAYDGDILSYGKHLGINLDVGHFVAGTNQSPLPLIERHHDRIVSLHLKDRKKNNGPNMPFGEGDTPIAEILQYMRDNKLTFPGDIELEYKVPRGSDAIKEVTKCVEFCRKALA